MNFNRTFVRTGQIGIVTISAGGRVHPFWHFFLRVFCEDRVWVLRMLFLV